MILSCYKWYNIFRNLQALIDRNSILKQEIVYSDPIGAGQYWEEPSPDNNVDNRYK